MDGEWLQIGQLALHVPTIAYVEKIAPGAATDGPRVRVGFMGGAYREVEGVPARDLLRWSEARAHALAPVAAD